MGSGGWTRASFTSYSKTKGMSVDSTGSITGSYHAQEMFKQREIAPGLNPYGVFRECCDSEEHPNTIPVILALDVTGSMGSAAVEVAKKLNVVMTRLYEKIKDVEFLIMGIGDLAYDYAPIQASQFESDIRIAEQLDQIYFEGGGGGNGYESYTAAWYFGVRHTELDCWKRGKRGILITMGDEALNPYLPIDGYRGKGLKASTGDNLEKDVETKDLYDEAVKKFDIYHLAVNDQHTAYKHYADDIHSSFGKYLHGNHLRVVTLDDIANEIVDIIKHSQSDIPESQIMASEDRLISW